MFTQDELMKLVKYSSVDTTDLLDLSTFAEFVYRPQSFYKHVYTQLANDKSEVVKCFASQNTIPNKLKFVHAARRMILYRIPKGESLDFRGVVPFPQREVIVDVAIGYGILEVTELSSQQTVKYCFKERTSWTFTKRQFDEYRLVLFAGFIRFILAFEQFVPEPICPLASSINLSPMEVDFHTDLCSGKSIIFKRVVPERIIFLASRFAVCRLGGHCPVQVTVIEAGRGLLFHSHICPRESIRNYETPDHGMSEVDLMVGMDQYVAYNLLLEIVKDAVVVGMNPYRQLSRIKIGVADLAGIRDLEATNAFRYSAGSTVSPVSKPVKWQLAALLRAQLNDYSVKDYRDSYNEAIDVERLYNDVKEVWKDDIVLTDRYEPRSDGDLESMMQRELLKRSPDGGEDAVSTDSEDVCEAMSVGLRIPTLVGGSIIDGDKDRDISSSHSQDPNISMHDHLLISSHMSIKVEPSQESWTCNGRKRRNSDTQSIQP